MKLIKGLLKKYNSIPIAAKATIWFVFCSVLQKCISLLTTPIFTRIMDTDQYGQFTVYNSWLQIFTIITTLRLNFSVFNKGMSKYKDDRDGYTSTMQSVTFMLTVLMFIIYLIFHRYINAMTELPSFIMIAIFAELLVTPAIDFWTIRKRYEYIYKPVVFRTILMTCLNAGLGIVAVMFANEKGYARILSCVLVNFCFGLTLFIYNLYKGKKIFCWEYAKFALLFNLPLLLHYFSQYILDQFDKIMIQKMIGLSAAALYGVAYNAGLIMKIVTQSVNNAIVPWQFEKLEKKAFKELDKTLFVVFAFIGGCSLMFSAFAPEIMMILAPDKYYEAVYVIPPVAISMFFTFAYTTFANTEFFYNQNKFTMYISMAGALLNVGLNYIFISLFGYIAAAYTTLFCYIVFTVAHYIYMSISVKKELGCDKVFNTKRLIILSLIVLVLGTVVVFFYNKMVLRYAIMLIIIIAALIKRKTIMSILKKSKVNGG